MTPRVRRYANEVAPWHQCEPEAIFAPRTRGPGFRAAVDVMQRLQVDGFSSRQIARWLGREASTIRHDLRNHARNPRNAVSALENRRQPVDAGSRVGA